jgi:hypothetical protein
VGEARHAVSLHDADVGVRAQLYQRRADEEADPDLRLARARWRLDRERGLRRRSRIAGQRDETPRDQDESAGEPGAHDLSRGSCQT